MIKAGIINRVKETLDRSKYLSNLDFTITTEKPHDSFAQLKIIYNFDERYKITINIPNRKGSNGRYDFTGDMCPGHVSLEEKISFSTLDDLFKNVYSWVEGIWSEISTSPMIREMDKQQEEINKILENLSNIPDEYFSKEEIKSFTEKLTKLEEDMKAQMEKSIQDKEELEKKIENLNRDIENLKITLTSSKKDGWRKNFITKAYKWAKDSDNRALLKDSYKIIKTLLPEQVKNVLP